MTPPAIPGWICEEAIGHGADATVWRARPAGGGAAMALKVIPLARLRDPAAHLREAWAAGSTGCRQVVAVYDAGQHGEHAWLAMELANEDAAMLAGLWGAHTAPLRHLGALVRGARLEGRWGEDQLFLRDAVYPLARGRACVHDSFFAREPWRRPFPTAREGAAFVGEVFDEDDRPRLSDRALLTRAERSRPRLLTLRARSWLRARLGR